MILNLGSAIFNTETQTGGGTPAWGTEMGQGDGYRFSFEDYEAFITSLVYNSIPNPQNRINCPLGKGGNQADNYEFVLASKFDKIFVNGTFISNVSFILLVIKKLIGSNHIGRRTLKYNPRITLDGINYNSHCFDSIAKAIGVSQNGAWFISELTSKNQDELHFTAHILDTNSTYTFSDSDDRKKVLLSKIQKYREAKNVNKLKHFSNFVSSPLPLQQILFGAPGTGKSHYIDKMVTGERTVRTTFHPDSDYSTFVGCYKPTKGDEGITYCFTPQAFINAYVEAWRNLEQPLFLIIEEINRGNCAQIFGDIFQLLDRDADGRSSYRITPDQDLAAYLKEQFADAEIDDDIKQGRAMRLPPNLHIWATMNTSDQSLFPIDSAFKRRWEWKYIPIDYTDRGHYIACDGNRYVWADFLQKVNERIEVVTQSEDKELGYWFMGNSLEQKEITAERFVSKVVFYLWSDVFKDMGCNGSTVFKDDFDKFHKFFDYDGSPKNDVVAAFLDSLEVSFVEFNQLSEDKIDDVSDASSGKFTLNGEKLSLRDISYKIVENFSKSHQNLNAEDIKRIFIDACKGCGISHIVETDDEYRQRSHQPSAERSQSPLTIPNGEIIHITNQWRAKKDDDNFFKFIEVCKNNNWGDIQKAEQ